MTITMYQASIPVLQKMLANLSGILTKAADYAEERKMDASVVLETRIFPDMFPLIRQVQITTDFAKSCGARLAGIPVPSFPDTETTFADLQTRLAATQEFLASLKPEQIDGTEERTISFNIHEHELNFKGLDYLTGFAIPNFYFHMTAAYAILRMCGMDLGKKDFLGKM